MVANKPVHWITVYGLISIHYGNGYVVKGSPCGPFH